ncbi:AzlC family ABC transporter permease [Hominifimenecus sp. rT4P-3]|uniref:AzlC family ABC transporter permease n=1 Tax=Hominifimenecus sp. rT4P-3 TaxID=3242979 RepID=UPI003DA66D8D
MKGNQEFRQGLRDGLPICLGYLSVSFAYGMKAVLAGLPAWIVTVISLSNLTSAGQFAGTNLILSGGSYLEIALTTGIINLRYFLMSLSMSQKVEEKMTFRQRLAVSFGVTDEIFAVSMQRPRELSAWYMCGLILTPVIGWTGGTFLGGVATTLLPESLSSALGIALYGMFIAVIVPPAKKQKPVLFTVLLAVAFSVLFHTVSWLSFLSGGWGIILITIVVSGIAAVLFPIKEEAKEEA